MKRRTLLATLGTATAAVAGCVAGDPEGPDGDRTDDGDADGGTGDGDGDERIDGGDDRTTSADADSVVAQFDGGPVRPECERESETVEVEYGDETREHETAETVPYPDAPAEFDRDDVVEYVEAFEHAYVTHDALCDYGSGHVLRVGYDVRRSETFDWYDDVTVVFLLRAGAATFGTDGRGNAWQADVAHEGVVYAVDETGAARAAFDEPHELQRDGFESEAPDPLDEGELVATFG